MSKHTEVNEQDSDENPLTNFSGCHEGIIKNFEQLGVLPDLIEQADKASEIRTLSAKLFRFYHDVVLEHHAEEEEELFAAVLDSLEEDDNSELAKKYIDRLVKEHRELEQLWKSIEPDIKRLSKGKSASLDIKTVEELSKKYLAHADFEEEYFLPLSEKILRKNGLSALGLSLHMRHDDVDIPGYI